MPRAVHVQASADDVVQIVDSPKRLAKQVQRSEQVVLASVASAVEGAADRPRSRSRSRSPNRKTGTWVVPPKVVPPRWDPPRDSSSQAPFHPPPPMVTPEEMEQLLPRHFKARLDKIYEDGHIKRGELDCAVLKAMADLPERLLEQVFTKIETEPVYIISARSKSGLMYSLCDKAKQGALHVCGVFADDPWKPMLQQMARPKRQQIDLVPEGEWLQRAEGEAVDLAIDLTEDKGVGAQSVRISLFLNVTVADLKARLSLLGSTIPVNQMTLREERLGHLRNDRSLAFYNATPGMVLVLAKRTRSRARKPHTLEELEALVLPPPLRVNS